MPTIWLLLILYTLLYVLVFINFKWFSCEEHVLSNKSAWRELLLLDSFTAPNESFTLRWGHLDVAEWLPQQVLLIVSLSLPSLKSSLGKTLIISTNWMLTICQAWVRLWDFIGNYTNICIAKKIYEWPSVMTFFSNACWGETFSLSWHLKLRVPYFALSNILYTINLLKVIVFFTDAYSQEIKK